MGKRTEGHSDHGARFFKSARRALTALAVLSVWATACGKKTPPQEGPAPVLSASGTPAGSVSAGVAASASVDRPPPVPVVVAKGQNRPVAVTIAGAFIYWVNHGVDEAGKQKTGAGSVQKAPIDGGDATVMADKQDLPMHVAKDATHIYWTLTSGVARAPLAGGPAASVTRVPQGQGVPSALAVGDEFVHVGIMHMTNGGIFKAAKKGGALLEVNGGLVMTDALAVDGESTFACVNGDVLARIPKGGDAKDAVVLAKGLQGCGGIAVDDASVYFSESKSGTLSRVAKAGGEAVVLARDLGEPHDVTVSSDFIYWLEWRSGRVARLSKKSGGVPMVVAGGLKAPRGLAVSAGTVAWCTPDDGTVMKVGIDGEGVAVSAPTSSPPSPTAPASAVAATVAARTGTGACDDFGVKLDMPREFERGASPDIPGRHVDMFRAPNAAQLLVEHGCFKPGERQTIDLLWDRALAEYKDTRVTYKKKAATWFVFSGFAKDGRIFYRKAIVDGARWATFNIRFAESLRSQYDPLLSGIERSLQIVKE